MGRVDSSFISSRSPKTSIQQDPHHKISQNSKQPSPPFWRVEDIQNGGEGCFEFWEILW
jgi:hypothetical protein